MMDPAEFDRFADEYRSLHARNIAISGEDPEFFAEYKIRDVAAESLAHHGEQLPAAILDFGAGIGSSVPYFSKHVPRARITCLDVSRRSLEVGEARFPGQARFVHFDGVRIPFPDESFDIVFAACVFHHIEHEHHIALLAEFRRVLASKGIAVVFEHNPYNPLTVRAVNTCAFDENARLITGRAMRRRLYAAGFRSVRIRYRIFFPHALRALRALEKWMRWVPLGAQYYAVALR